MYKRKQIDNPDNDKRAKKNNNNDNYDNDGYAGDGIDIYRFLNEYENNRLSIIKDLKNPKVSNLEKVRLLLKQKIFKDLRDEEGRSILEIACQHPCITLEIFQLLIENGNPVATFNGPIEDEDEDKGEDEDKVELTTEFANKLLLYLCRNENINLDIIKLLIETRKADPNAVIEDPKAILLHNSEASLNDGITPLFCVCSNKSVTLETIKYLIDNGADLYKYHNVFSENDINKISPATELLHQMAYRGNVNRDIIKYFVDTYAADVNGMDGDGKNLMHWACGSETAKADIQYLVESGVDLEKKDRRGMNPVHIFFDSYLTSIEELTEVEFNLEQGSDQNTLSIEEQLSLEERILDLEQQLLFKKEITDYLLTQHFDVNVTDGCDKQTLLHRVCCIEFINPKNIYSIIKKSSPSVLNMKDSKGETPLDLAYAYHNLNALILLLLDGRDVGLMTFDFDQFKDVRNDLTEAGLTLVNQMHTLLNAAKESNEAFKTELGNLPAKCIINLPAECLIKLAEEGCLSTVQLAKLKKREIFSTGNVEHFSAFFRKKLVSFTLCMKELNKHFMFKLPKPVINTIILPEILHTESVCIRENRESTRTFKK